MDTNKILIIKRISNDFDKFVVRNLATLDTNIEARDVFKGNNKLSRKIIKIIKKYGLMPLFLLCLNISKKEIKKYSQIILFDDYPDDLLIKWIKKNNSRCKVKLWLWNIPDYSIDRLRELCNIYCFDQAYAKRQSIDFIEQFYFDEYVNGLDTNFIEQQVCYIGYDKNRKELLDRLAEVFEKNLISYKFQLVSNNQLGKVNERYQIQKYPVAYSTVVDTDCKSNVIVEIVSGVQQGLTWRTLEALFLNKKMITNNLAIKEFDFYRKENIFIIDEDRFDDLPQFLSNPAVEIDSRIKDKYRAKSWLNEITR